MQRRHRYGKRQIYFAPRKATAAALGVPTERVGDAGQRWRTGRIVDDLNADFSEREVARAQLDTTDAQNEHQTQTDSNASHASGILSVVAFMKHVARYFALENAQTKEGQQTQSAVFGVCGGPAVNTEVRTSASAVLNGSGKSYSNIQASGHTRMHLGDVHTSTTNNNQISVSGFAGSLMLLSSLRGESISSQELGLALLATMALSAAVNSAVARSICCMIILLKVAILNRSLPKQIDFLFATFEDAFGRKMRFEIGGMINDWQTFHFVVTNNHQGRPGYRRVLNAWYRLSDDSINGALIDPRNPPAFATVFRHGATIHMSIHFRWYDLVDEPCPGCGLVQACKIDAETMCSACGVPFRAYTGDVKVENLSSYSEAGPEDNDSKTSMQRRATPSISSRSNLKAHKRQLDSASSFSHISVAKHNDFRHRLAMQNKVGSHLVNQYIVEGAQGQRNLYYTGEEARHAVRRSESLQGTLYLSQVPNESLTRTKTSESESIITIQGGGTVLKIPCDSTLVVRRTEEVENEF